jgi:hypothetical protein
MTKEIVRSQAWWYTLVIPATQEAEAGGSQIPGQARQKSARPYLKNKAIKRGPGELLKGGQSPEPPKKKRKYLFYIVDLELVQVHPHVL